MHGILPQWEARMPKHRKSFKPHPAIDAAAPRKAATPTPESRIPQVIITLSPDGLLQAELPHSGGRHHVLISSLEDISQILAAQLRQTPETIGLDRSPPNGQIKHWDKHLDAKQSDPNCPWCIAAELGIDTSRKAYFNARKALCTWLAAKSKHKRPTPSKPNVTVIASKSPKISKRKADFTSLFDDL